MLEWIKGVSAYHIFLSMEHSTNQNLRFFKDGRGFGILMLSGEPPAEAVLCSQPQSLYFNAYLRYFHFSTAQNFIRSPGRKSLRAMLLIPALITKVK